ncbi:MAG: glutamine synthetase [Chloroflexi bacterium]|nr:glutamine synthetase [Chloroflexota bacterium]
MPQTSTPQDVLSAAQAAGVELVHLQFTDVPGAIKSISIPASRLQRVLQDGAWFDGSAVEGLARVAERDLYLRPDPTTFAVLPWEATPTARLICDLGLPGGTPFKADPRAVLHDALARAREGGLCYRVACEVEFFVFSDDTPGEGELLPVDRSGYFEMHGNRASSLCYAAVDALDAFGVGVEATHHEVGPGQYEIDLADDDALRVADGIVALKWALRALGRRSGMRVSFMPKPLEHASGSGLHVSQVLAGAQAENLFFAADERYALSPLACQFMAGQLAHARGMCAIIAPLVNSYKRLGGGAEAPARVTWARVNRGALLRVPESSSGPRTLLELRAPDPSCNPYLAFAAMLEAGLDGIARQLPLPEPIEEPDAPDNSEAVAEQLANPLPATLGEALEELEWDPVVREALGQPVVERFLAAKEAEWLAFSRHISAWERARYLDTA